MTNLNVSGVVSFYPQLLTDGRFEVYGGGAVNRYSGWVRSEVRRVTGSASVPSVIAGFRVGRFPEVTTSSRSTRRRALVSIGLEVMGAWLRERGSARALVPGGRLYLSIGGLVR